MGEGNCEGEVVERPSTGKRRQVCKGKVKTYKGESIAQDEELENKMHT